MDNPHSLQPLPPRTTAAPLPARYPRPGAHMPTKPTSKLKSATSRANGAKSRGPVTPEGRSRSSRNALRHGLTAKSPNLPPANVVLTTESKEDFQILLDSYLLQFAPQPGVETELVYAMAVARWRLRRTAAIETLLLNNEMLRLIDEIDADFEKYHFKDVEPIDGVTFAFKKLADNGPSLALLLRYEGTLNRSHDRAFKQLQILQAVRNRAQPNEPKLTTSLPYHTQSKSPISGPLPANVRVPAKQVQSRRKIQADRVTCEGGAEDPAGTP